MRDENAIVYMQLKVSLKSGIFIKLFNKTIYMFSNNCKKSIKKQNKSQIN